jgi:hypothetical protein
VSASDRHLEYSERTVELGLSIISSPSRFDPLLRVGDGSASSLELSSFTTTVGSSAFASTTSGLKVSHAQQANLARHTECPPEVSFLIGLFSRGPLVCASGPLWFFLGGADDESKSPNSGISTYGLALRRNQRGARILPGHLRC